MKKWLCISEYFKYSQLWQPGDVLELETDENPGHHFTEHVDGVFSVGRRIGVVNDYAYRIDDE